MKMDRQADDIRREVSASYTKAVKRPSARSSCCGSQKGVAASLAGYSSEQLSTLPDDAVLNSFGCGNPVGLAEIGKGDVVLDLGSGAGIDLLLAARLTGPEGRVIGVDMTEEMIARARKNATDAGFTNIDVRYGLIENLPVETSTVDLVVSNCVINLSPEKEKVFAEVARVLKPGGRFSISDLVADDLPVWVRDSSALYSSCISGAISEAAYIQGMLSAGLSDVKVIDRMVYDSMALLALVDSELVGCSCCSSSANSAEASLIADALGGKVASIRVTGRKI